MNKKWKCGLLVASATVCLLAGCNEKDDTTADLPVNTTGSTGQGTVGTTAPEVHTHSFGPWEIVTEATCTEEGSQRRACDCGEVEEEVIPARGHTEMIVLGYQPTCTEEGMTDGKVCVSCSATLEEQQQIAPLGHQPVVDEAKDPTCTETGLTEGSHCGVCNVVLTAQKTVEPLGHDYTNYVFNNDATCTENGTETGTCSRCEQKDTRIKENSAMGHTPVTEDGTEASCTAVGWTDRSYCQTCQTVLIERQLVPAKGHQYENGVCSQCGQTEVKTSSGLIFALNEDKLSYSVIGMGDCKDSHVTIPEVHMGLPVTAVGENAFAGCEKLEGVTIPNGITVIGRSAFEGCFALATVELPDSLETICANAFQACGRLNTIKIPSGVTKIGAGAFFFCHNIKSVYITDLAAWCRIEFDGVGANPLSVANHLYVNGRLVTDLVIPAYVTKIGDYAFTQCTSLKTITLEDGVTHIGNNAFYYCTGLTGVSFGNTVESIGYQAFDGCEKLRKLELPASLRSIGAQAFVQCKSLRTITVEQGNEVYEAVDNCLIEKETGTLILGCGTSVIPTDGSVRVIGQDAFSGAVTLEKIIIPKSVKTIGKFAFNNCPALTDIIFEGTMGRWSTIEKDKDWIWDAPNYSLTCMNEEVLELEKEDVTLSPENGLFFDIYDLIKNIEDFDLSAMTVTVGDDGVVWVDGSRIYALSNCSDGVPVTVTYQDQKVTCLVRVKDLKTRGLNKTDVTLILDKEGYGSFVLKLLDENGDPIRVQWNFSKDFPLCCDWSEDPETGLLTITAKATTADLENGTFVKAWTVYNGEKYQCIIRVK